MSAACNVPVISPCRSAAVEIMSLPEPLETLYFRRKTGSLSVGKREVFIRRPQVLKRRAFGMVLVHK